MLEKDTKFDEFIEDFDKTLNKDTSTLRTISSQTSPLNHMDLDSSPLITEQHVVIPLSHESNDEKESQFKDNVGLISPILSTPTKSNRNSITLDKQPLVLSGKDKHSSTKTVKLADKLLKEQHQQEGKETVELKGPSSLKKRGFNLNIAINGKQNKSKKELDGLRSPSKGFDINSSIQVAHQQQQLPPKLRMRSDSLKTLEQNEDLNDSLRQLALKEMKIIELKDELKLINIKLEQEQLELTELRNKIGNNLYKDIKINNSPSKTSKFDNLAQKDYKDNETDKFSKNDSYWAKPINFLNQFDQILQNEFEKLNHLEQHIVPEEANDENKDHNKERKGADDVLNSVSNSIWSFVSDVKSGLLGEDDEENYSGVSRRRQGNNIRKNQTVDLDKNIDHNEQEMIMIHK
ncbi:hypothetical protein WICMUC_002023 [Wickerhamomyces mucosus]|uniref:Topoisomerase I damage affected protein 11 n=1 Tax=Wickerhamomyces mucosus TaxID=1378264 RepID=A0A9P8PRR3_9ASCO|nr:hypothetical protein WICMUC_002023 [Wickerhamomyces mucosus]